MEDFELAERLVKIANKLLEADSDEDHDEEKEADSDEDHDEEKEADCGEDHDEEKEATEVKAEDEEVEEKDEEKEAAAEGGRAEYKKYFEGKMDKYKIDSPSELSDEDKKKFFSEVDKDWKSDDEGSTASDDSEEDGDDEDSKEARVSSDNEIAMQILEIAKEIKKSL